jgi:thiol-disulfide isomerase/thioredoxin
MLGGVAAIALGLDTGILARVSTASTGGLEQALVGRLAAKTPADDGTKMAGPAMMAAGGAMMKVAAEEALPIEGTLPPLDGAVQWLNSPPLTTQALKGKVVLVDFWTYSCINCLRTLPYVRAWAEKYRDQGLVVIGVHAPEFAFERDPDNVTKAVRDLGIHYPVALDNDYRIWRAFGNEYWPAHYFADAQGRIRYHHFGEGDYAESERVIQQLLREAGAAHGTDVAPDGSGSVTEQRPYQLVRQPGDVEERTFSIEFLDPNVSAYAFTFG